MKNKIAFLDGLRGLAALYVVIHHARWVLWEGYADGYLKDPKNYDTIKIVLMYIFSAFKYGHEIVILFFVLSGFVIHLKYSKQIARDGRLEFSWLPYFYRRVRRIVPPMLLAILLTFCLDFVGLYFDMFIYSKPSLYLSINENLQVNHDLFTLLGNLFFLMKIYVPVWGTNGPLWSLAYEWWFYMFYPIFLWLNYKNVWLPFFILALLSFLGTISFFQIPLLDKVTSFMFIWWLGVLLADMYTGRVHIPFVVLIPLIAIIPLLLIDSVNSFILPFLGPYYFHLWGLGFIGFFSLMFVLAARLKYFELHRLKGLGDISYSVYILHMPVLTLMSAGLMEYNVEGRLPNGFLWMCVGIILSLFVGYLGYILVEKPILKINESKFDVQSSGNKGII